MAHSDFSRIFVDRPILAAVLSILIFVAGLIAVPNLPISEYPDVDDTMRRLKALVSQPVRGLRHDALFARGGECAARLHLHGERAELVNREERFVRAKPREDRADLIELLRVFWVG